MSQSLPRLAWGFKLWEKSGFSSISNAPFPRVCGLLGGSWVAISGVIRPLIWVISIVILLIALLITTHEPPSRGLGGARN